METIHDQYGRSIERPYHTTPEIEELAAHELVTEVLQELKSGKEATVYLCRAHPSVGAPLLAAKVYRSLHHRDFRNDAVYREGRYIADKRLRRAIEQKSRKGREAGFDMWIQEEYQTLRLLHDAGADVPAVYDRSTSALLMEYIGDDTGAAPMLHRVRLQDAEAQPLFNRLLWNLELMLAHGRVHADLSPFNILYWQGEFRIIDFPQVVDPNFNREAPSLLERDLRNVCKYWSRYAVHADPALLARQLWRRFETGRL